MNSMSRQCDSLRRRRRIIALWLALPTVAISSCNAADLDEIIRRGTATIQSDWAADPDYAYVERDETQQNGSRTSRAYQVVLMDGSDYSMPLAVNDQPLSPDQARSELQKLKNEFDRRETESPAARTDRIAKYKKIRDENGSLLLAFPIAFHYKLLSEETMNGHPAYVLAASPKKRTGPLTRAEKVLSGMSGTLWIDQAHDHVIRGDCTVVNAVSVYGILARVLPGTHIRLDMAPVNGSTWLISELDIDLSVLKFFWFRSTQETRSTYSDYRLNTQVLPELLSKASHISNDTSDPK